MNTTRFLATATAALASLLATGAQAQTQIFPIGATVVLSQPGAYKLMGNLTVPQGKTALSVTADGVSIDLNGFALIGSTRSCEQPQGSFTPSCNLAYSANETVPGIAGRDNLIVRNGRIQGFGIGVQFTCGGRAENLTLRHNRTGIQQQLNYPMTLGGMGGVQVSDVVVEFNQFGMQLSSAMVDRALVKNNQYGISTPSGAFPVLVRNSLIVGQEVGVSYAYLDTSTRFIGNRLPMSGTTPF